MGHPWYQARAPLGTVVGVILMWAVTVQAMSNDSGATISAFGFSDGTNLGRWKRVLEDEKRRMEDGGTDLWEGGEEGRTDHLGCERMKRDVKDVPPGCKTPPVVEHIRQEWQRSDEGALGVCDTGYESPFGGRELLIVCMDGDWESLPWPDPSNPSCVPVCSLGCGDGRCVAPNTCECPYGLNGSRCEVAPGCSEAPLLPRHSKFAMGRPGRGNLTCEEGYGFLSNASTLSLVCIDGLWFAPEVKYEENEMLSEGRIQGDGIMCRKNLDDDSGNASMQVPSDSCMCPEGYFGPQCKIKCEPLRQVPYAFHYRNANVSSSPWTLELKCWPGYSISKTNYTKINIHCKEGVWKTAKELNTDYHNVSCELTCADEEKGMDGCQNGGTCLEDRVCVCSEKFDGQFCEIRRCLLEELVPLYDAYYFLTDEVSPEGNPVLMVQCREGFHFPDGSSVIYSKCRDGKWDFDAEKFQRCLSHCNIICEPPLSCVGPNQCGCDRDARSAGICERVLSPDPDAPFPIVNRGNVTLGAHGKYYVKCREGYQINNHTQLEMIFFNQTWLLIGVPPAYRYDCKPRCVPPCLNRQECVYPDQCECLPPFEGTNCQTIIPIKPVCPDSYPFITHGNVSDDGVLTCIENFRLSVDLNSTELICVDGHYTAKEGDGVCHPVCEPECYNGGTCWMPATCHCPEGFSGPRCQITTCPDRMPELPFTTIVQCTDTGPQLICQLGYKFPSGEDTVPLFCDQGVWTVFGDPKLPSCSPVCEPKCENGGECVAPQKCYCPPDFGGPTCDFPKCASLPNSFVNAKFLNKGKKGIAFCTDGYTFNSKSGAEKNITCVNGKWDVWINGERRNEVVKITPQDIGEMVLFPLACLPMCNPFCLNGGTCVGHNLCSCPPGEIGSGCHAHTCPCPLPFIVNADYMFGGATARVSCKPGFKFSFGKDVISLTCLITEWVVHRYDSFVPPTCIPVCEQECFNGGVCQEDGTCACPPGYSGRSCELDMDGLCLQPPPPLNNTMLRLTNLTGTYTCLPEYRLRSDNETTVQVECRNSTWVFPEYVNSSTSPECVFWCDKESCGLEGVCLPTGKCLCPIQWTGERCNELVPGIKCPKLNLNNTEVELLGPDGNDVQITCLEGYEMSNGMTVLNMTCVEGMWLSRQPTHYDDALGCKPVCHHPCLNGGECVAADTCECAEFFYGEDCSRLVYRGCLAVIDKPENLTLMERNDSLVLRCKSERPIGAGEVEMLVSCQYGKWNTPLNWSWNITCAAREMCTTPHAPQNAYIIQNATGTYVACDEGFNIDGDKVVRLECIPDVNTWGLMDTRTFFVDEVACTVDEGEVCNKPCGPNGLCVRNRCVCYPGWTGAFCRTHLCTSTDFLVDGAEGSSFIKPGERVIVFCPPGHRLSSGKVSVMLVCNKGSWMLTGSMVAQKRARCKPVCDPPCHNLGYCVGPNTCKCLYGFTGDACTICGDIGALSLTTSGMPCTLPYHFNDKLYNDCYQADHDSPAWCPTMYNMVEREVMAAGLCLLDWGYRRISITYPGDACRFPYYHEGSLYDSCVTYQNLSFCAVTVDMDRRPLIYQQCASKEDVPIVIANANPKLGEMMATMDGRLCDFPFVFNGTTYHECALSEESRLPWCATKVDKNRVVQEYSTCTTTKVTRIRKDKRKVDITKICETKK